MQLNRLSRKLEGIEDASKKGRPVTDLFKIMTNVEEIWYEAYANIYSNSGAITKGVNENTLDGFSEERVEQIICRLKGKKYKFTPVRRTYIPKRKANKKRPLGVPIGDDKLVGEVVRILLERIYEPIFLNNSHGFRRGKSCHTALLQIRKQWTAVKWFIEFDIREFFDNIDHSLLISILQKRIDDRRFIKLIKHMLKAGYLEDWKFYPTYTGTPQGGVCSPILANIYLHELDVYILELAERFTKGKRRRNNPEYSKLNKQKHRLRKKIDQFGRKPEWISQLVELDKISRTIPARDPYDPNYRRLRYCRYADDFVCGVIGSKQDATEIMNRISEFIGKLKLQIAEEKTKVKSAREGIQFLSYEIRTQYTKKLVRIKNSGRYTTSRTVNGHITLRVPQSKVRDFCQKYGYGDWQSMRPIHRPELLNISDVEIICTYNAELRGLCNYYYLADDVKYKLQKLEYLANYSFFKTLAAKHKTKKSEILKKLKRGNEYIIEYEVDGEKRELKVFKLKHMICPSKDWEIDKIPNTFYLTSFRSELVKRLNYQRCEYCGKADSQLESHHVKKLKDLKKKNHLKKWEIVMIGRRRKTLVLCKECHDLLHAGKLPDKRYQEYA
jgi:RNA-directed DNA polymerase